MSDIYKLDGTDDIKPTAFDTHEQVARQNPALASPPVEFPKAVAHDQETGEPVIAKDAKHEAQLKKALAEAKKEAKG